MSDHARIRASDAERERAAEALREHYAAGRITQEELSERLDAAYHATTLAELDRLREDLPELPLPPSAARAELAARQAHLRRQLLQRAGSAFSPFLICTLIWAASGASAPFWPVWVLIFPLLYLIRNGWHVYGPAPQLDRVQLELEGRRQRPRRAARRGRRGELR